MAETWTANPGKQYTHTEITGETFVDAQEFELVPPDEMGEGSKRAVVNYDRETLFVDDEEVEPSDPMHDTYWAAINAAGAVR